LPKADLFFLNSERTAVVMHRTKTGSRMNAEGASLTAKEISGELLAETLTQRKSLDSRRLIS
jgi:hypothetical protein